MEVTADQAYGQSFVNITVNKPLRINEPPVAVIAPPHQEITLPNSNTVLDGAGKLFQIEGDRHNDCIFGLYKKNTRLQSSRRQLAVMFRLWKTTLMSIVSDLK